MPTTGNDRSFRGRRILETFSNKSTEILRNWNNQGESAKTKLRNTQKENSNFINASYHIGFRRHLRAGSLLFHVSVNPGHERRHSGLEAVRIATCQTQWV